MMKVLLMLAAMLAPRALALSSEAAEAIHAFQECAPDAATACTKAGTCTQAQFCSLCSAVDKASASSCRAKAKAHSVAEAISGHLQGSCAELCGSKIAVAAVASQGHSDGDSVLVTHGGSGRRAFGAVVSAKGTTLSDLYVGPEKKKPGSIVIASDSSVAPEVATAFKCLKDANSQFLTSCMTSPAKCNDKKLAKTGRCNICDAVKTCKDGQSFVEGFFETSCSGC